MKLEYFDLLEELQQYIDFLMALTVQKTVFQIDFRDSGYKYLERALARISEDNFPNNHKIQLAIQGTTKVCPLAELSAKEIEEMRIIFQDLNSSYLPHISLRVIHNDQVVGAVKLT